MHLTVSIQIDDTYQKKDGSRKNRPLPDCTAIRSKTTATDLFSTV